MSYISCDESHGTAAAELMPRQLSHNPPGQMNALLDSLTDDDEDDVKDTLHRLEGHINPKEQQEKMTKVEGRVRTIHDSYVEGTKSSAPQSGMMSLMRLVANMILMETKGARARLLPKIQRLRITLEMATYSVFWWFPRRIVSRSKRLILPLRCLFP
jgi:hypothetical protein